MKNVKSVWSKVELKIYILLLCARADSEESTEELELIKAKSDEKSFDRLYAELLNDNEDISIQKIENAIARLEYSYKELRELKQEVLEVFKTDKKVDLREYKLSELLDNILY